LRFSRLFFAIFLAVLFITPVIAQRTYYIGKDEGGIYLQTDNHGGWYINKEDFENVKIGETGIYAVGLDHNGTFLMTDKHGKIYIELETDDQFEQQIWNYNTEQVISPNILKTKVFLLDNQILVPVILGYGSKQTEVLLLLDTGASITMLHKEIAEQLNIKSSRKTSFTVVGGHDFVAEIAKLNYVNVGPLKKTNIKAAFIEHKGSSVPYQGFLGMNFLEGIEFQIDYKNRVIWWKP